MNKKTTNTQLKWKVNGRKQIEDLKHTMMVQDEANEDEPKEKDINTQNKMNKNRKTSRRSDEQHGIERKMEKKHLTH